MKHHLRAALVLPVLLGFAATAAAQGQDRPMADDHADRNAAVKSPDKMLYAPLAKGHNSFTLRQARARLQKAGYQHVTDLAKDHDGLWQGRAMWHGRPVHVALDYKGNAQAQ